MIKYIEELSMNAWPSLNTMHYDGWILRFSNGFTKRANSIYPLYDAKIDVNKKIKKCEDLYKSRNLHTIFKMTPSSSPKNLDEALYQRGYNIIDPTSVQVLNLNNISDPTLHDVTISSYPDDDWLANYCSMSNFKSGDFHTFTLILNNIIPEKVFLSIQADGKTVGCGLGVIENGYVGLFDIVVDPLYRGHGYGEQLVMNLLKAGKFRGAKTAYLQVVIENQPAMHLYDKLGFSELYEYWYRIK